MHTRQGGRVDLFSLWITAACIVAGAAIFLYSTAPALREYTWLSGVARQQAKLQESLRSHIALLRAKQTSLQEDVQTLLMAIDDLGLTPRDLIDAPELELFLYGPTEPGPAK